MKAIDSLRNKVGKHRNASAKGKKRWDKVKVVSLKKHSDKENKKKMSYSNKKIWTTLLEFKEHLVLIYLVEKDSGQRMICHLYQCKGSVVKLVKVKKN